MVTLDRIYLADAKLEIQFMSEHWKYHVKVWMKKLGHAIGKLRTILFRSYEEAPRENITEAVSFQCRGSHAWMGIVLKLCFIGELLKERIIEVFLETWPCLIEYQWHVNKKTSTFWKLTALTSWQYNNVRTNTILHSKHLHRLALAIHLSFCERKLQDVNVVDVLNVGKCIETSSSLNRGFN